MLKRLIKWFIGLFKKKPIATSKVADKPIATPHVAGRSPIKPVRPFKLTMPIKTMISQDRQLIKALCSKLGITKKQLKKRKILNDCIYKDGKLYHPIMEKQ